MQDQSYAKSCRRSRVGARALWPSTQATSVNTVESMGLGIGMVTIDCLKPQLLAAFWSAALEVPVQADYGDFVFLSAPSNDGLMLGLQRVSATTDGKNRIHIDLRGGSLETETPRLWRFDDR